MLVISLRARANKEHGFVASGAKGQRKQSGVNQRDKRRRDDAPARCLEKEGKIKSGESRERSHVRRAEKRCRKRSTLESVGGNRKRASHTRRHEFARQWRING